MSLMDGIRTQDNLRARLKALKQTHPVFDRYVSSWQVGLDAYDGSGGFLTGEYLWDFPREDVDAYRKRKAQARYHNYVETLIDTYVRALTTEVVRKSSDAGLTNWWLDVDGRGATMSSYIMAVLGQALAAGHAGVLVDKASDLPNGPAVADDPNQPYLVTFAAPAILDWRMDTTGLAAVKLSEAPTVTGLETKLDDTVMGFLLWDREQWARFDEKGNQTGGNPHDLGRVPFEVLRPKPSRRHPFIGKALITASVIKALYNRGSEEDLVLRDQAFSLFVVQLPQDATDDDMLRVEKTMAAGVGTTTVSIIKGTADFKTASMEVPGTLREHQKFLVTEIYRMAHLRFQRDSLDAQSAEAIRLQDQELNSMLKGIAEDLMAFEKALARLYFDWTTPNGEQAYDRAKVEISYPTSFEVPDLVIELTALQQAINLQLGATATKALKKRVVTLTLPDLEEQTLKAVQDEIDAAQEGDGLNAPGNDLRARAAARLKAAGVTIAEQQAA